MNFIKIDGRTYFSLAYRDFYASNLSEYGLVVFNPYLDNISQIKEYLNKKEEYLGFIQTLVLEIYNFTTQTSHSALLLINKGKLSPFGFFNEIRFMCNRLSIHTDFYACDFDSDRIYKTNICSINEIGTLNKFAEILGLDEDNKIVFPFLRWAAPYGYNYFSSPKVFRNDAERDFYTYMEIVGEKSFDKFYTWEELKDKVNNEDNTLKLPRDAIIEFDIDNPSLSLSGGTIKAKNLIVKQITCEDLFCDSLTCRRAECTNILADKIVAESISANLVKTNFKHGISMKGVKDEERI